MTGEIIKFPPEPRRLTKPREAVARDIPAAIRPGVTAQEVVNTLRTKWSSLGAAEIHSGFAAAHRIVETVHQLALAELSLDHGPHPTTSDDGEPA